MPLRCLLIGGRSNVGKSTVAETLAARLGGVHRSTDKLGRHPGRPWGIVPPHVVAHYMNHTDEAIFDALLAHQRSMQPAIAELMRITTPICQGLYWYWKARRSCRRRRPTFGPPPYGRYGLPLATILSGNASRLRAATAI